MASSWPSAWQHFRQFCSNDGSEVRLKGFNSSHELQRRLTENPMSLHCSGVNSERVNWIRAKKIERKGDIYFVQSILNNSQRRAKNRKLALAPDLSRSSLPKVWKLEESIFWSPGGKKLLELAAQNLKFSVALRMIFIEIFGRMWKPGNGLLLKSSWMGFAWDFKALSDLYSLFFAWQELDMTSDPSDVSDYTDFRALLSLLILSFQRSIEALRRCRSLASFEIKGTSIFAKHAMAKT